MKSIPLSVTGKKNSGKYSAQVDDWMYPFLVHWKWTVSISKGKKYAVRYVLIGGVNYIIWMHRFIIGVTDSNIKVDHEDGDGLNCQEYNLREATNSQNQFNKKSQEGSTSKFVGVCKVIGKRRHCLKNGEYKEYLNTYWYAKVKVNNKIVFSKPFKTEIAAALARDEAAKKYHGKFANLNFK